MSMRHCPPSRFGTSIAYLTVSGDFEPNCSDEDCPRAILYAPESNFRTWGHIMAGPDYSIFRHQHNENDTFDSICTQCYLTIASANDEQHLFLLERIHVCDPVRLYEITSGTWPLYLPSAA